jgi:hypothetical protein
VSARGAVARGEWGDCNETRGDDLAEAFFDFACIGGMVSRKSVSARGSWLRPARAVKLRGAFGAQLRMTDDFFDLKCVR